jgi:hypothetical protein
LSSRDDFLNFRDFSFYALRFHLFTFLKNRCVQADFLLGEAFFHKALFCFSDFSPLIGGDILFHFQISLSAIPAFFRLPNRCRVLKADLRQ